MPHFECILFSFLHLKLKGLTLVRLKGVVTVELNPDLGIPHQNVYVSHKTFHHCMFQNKKTFWRS